MANEITFDKLPQAVGYLTEQVERQRDTRRVGTGVAAHYQ